MAEGYSRRGFRAYVLLILSASLLTGLNSILGGNPQFFTFLFEFSPPVNTLVEMLILFFVYGLLGLFGCKLAGEVGLPSMWRAKYPGFEDYYEPGLLGLAAAGMIIGLEMVFSSLPGPGMLPVPDLPMSIFDLLIGAVADEVIYRLFLLPFLIYILVKLWRKMGGKGLSRRQHLEKKLFWPAAVLTGVIYTAFHLLDIFMMLDTSVMDGILLPLSLRLLIMNLLLALFAAWQYRKKGFLAAVFFKVCFGVGWYVIWGGFLT